MINQSIIVNLFQPKRKYENRVKIVFSDVIYKQKNKTWLYLEKKIDFFLKHLYKKILKNESIFKIEEKFINIFLKLTLIITRFNLSLFVTQKWIGYCVFLTGKSSTSFKLT